jgi:hypothetical protein
VAAPVASGIGGTRQASNATGGLDPTGGIKGKRPSKKDKLRHQAQQAQLGQRHR